MKKLLSVVIPLSLLFVISVCVRGTEEKITASSGRELSVTVKHLENDPENLPVVDDFGVIGRDMSRYEWEDNSMRNGRKSNTFDFELTLNYAHAKIFVVNRSNSTVNIQFHKGSPTGPLVENGMFQLTSDHQNTFYVHANGNYDMYYCIVTTKDGSLLDGQITIQTATTGFATTV